MTTSEQLLKMKCPYPNCGWIRTMSITLEGGQVEVVVGVEGIKKGLNESIKKVLKKWNEMLSNPNLEEINSWLPMPPCPNCAQVYEYNIHNRKIRMEGHADG